jgi:uncharacterized protein (DUF697 family)
MANTVSVNKLKEIYDEVMGESDRTITISILGRNKVGKAEVGAWFLLDRGSLVEREIADIIICEFDAKAETVASAVVAASQADIILFVVDVSVRDNKKDLAVWQAVRDMKKPYLLVGNKLDQAGEDANTIKHRLADVFGAPLNQIAVISATQGTNVLAELMPRIVAQAKDVEIPLARRFPVFRKAVSNRIITATAAENVVIGALIFLPGADMPVMTANQVKMILKIAVVYGQDIGIDRLKELLVVFGSAVAFRAVARNLVAFVPVLGWAVKGGIAYAGTVALGKTAIKYFENDAELPLPGAKALKAGQDIIDV